MNCTKIAAEPLLMEWMPPPDGIAMCQNGDAEVITEGGGIHERG